MLYYHNKPTILACLLSLQIFIHNPLMLVRMKILFIIFFQGKKKANFGQGVMSVTNSLIQKQCRREVLTRQIDEKDTFPT